MIIFAIPLRAKETTKDWDGVLKRFNRTIKSIFNQTDPNFKCIVACNKIPSLEKEYDERLEFIELNDLAIPQTWIEMSRDKFWKLTAIAVRIREILENSSEPEKGIYVMPVDADDLFNRNIAAYCEKYTTANGLVSRDGYVWESGKQYFRIYNKMHTYNGSCNIIKMYLDDLPTAECISDSSLCHDKETAGKLNAKFPIRFDHNTVVQKYAENGKPFSILPFRSTIYVLGTGENISSIFHSEHCAHIAEKRRFHPVAFLRRINIFKMRYISKAIKVEFGIEMV